MIEVGRALHAAAGHGCVMRTGANTECCDDCLNDGYRVARQLQKRDILEAVGGARWRIHRMRREAL